MPRPSLIRQKRTELTPVIARAFAELGYRRATTAELARRCKVRENILYRLWPDKKAMFIAAIDHIYDLSLGIWNRILADGSKSGGAVRLIDYEARHHGEFGLYKIVFAGLSETDDPQIRQALRRMYARFQSFIAARISEHRKGTGKRLQPDQDLAAWAILGLGTLANIGRHIGLLSARERERLFEQVARPLVNGRA